MFIIVQDADGVFRVVKGVHIVDGIHCTNAKKAAELCDELNGVKIVDIPQVRKMRS